MDDNIEQEIRRIMNIMMDIRAVGSNPTELYYSDDFQDFFPIELKQYEQDFKEIFNEAYRRLFVIKTRA